MNHRNDDEKEGAKNIQKGRQFKWTTLYIEPEDGLSGAKGITEG